MNQVVFVAVTALVVFGMFVAGWVAGILSRKLGPNPDSDSAAIGDLTRKLMVIEAERDNLEQALEELKKQTASEAAARNEDYYRAVDQLQNAQDTIDRLESSIRELMER